MGTRYWSASSQRSTPPLHHSVTSLGVVDLVRVFERAQRRRGLRNRTVIERTRTLERLALRGPLLELTTDEIEEWLDDQRITIRSRGAYLSHIHAFYAWCVIAGHRIDDPTTPIDRPRLPKKVPRPIGDADLEMALSMADARMRCWLTLACYAGLRCMEISQLTREDVLDSHDPPLLRVLDGKGGKEGVVPLHPAILDALRTYGMPRSGPLFLSVRRTKFSPATVSGYIADFLHGLGMGDTAHRLRDWFGTALYAETLDLRLTQEMMRHSDPSSTAGYVAFNQPGAVHAVIALRAHSDNP